MMSWISNWLHGGASEEEVHAAEEQLRLEIAKHTLASESTKAHFEQTTARTNGIIKTLEKALQAAKRGENDEV